MKAIIEIPKGDNRRRHIKKDKTGFIDLGPLKEVIPVNDGVMMAHYGYIPDTFNKSDEDEVDVIILSDRKAEVGEEIEIKPIAVMMREDGDNKVIAVDSTRSSIKSWNDVSTIEKDFLEKFVGFHHRVRSIEGVEYVTQLLEDCSKN